MNVINTLGFFSLVALCFGGGLVWTASQRPSHAMTLERWGGALLAAGLALLGAALHTSAGVG